MSEGGQEFVRQEGDTQAGSSQTPSPATPEEELSRPDETEPVSDTEDAKPVLSVVMPTLNEQEGIRECITKIRGAFAELGIEGEIIVSDSSTDRTPDIAREMDATVVTPDAPGYGYAYRYAFRYARGEYIAIGDADTTYDFEELPKLYRHVAEGEADMAMGSRLGGEILPGSMPRLHQYVGNPFLTRFLNQFYKAGVSDAHSGMRVISRDALDKLELQTTGMEFASEMIMEAGARDLTIAEEPITYHPRKGEATLESFRDGWRHVRFMLENAPGYLFSGPSLVFGTIGVLAMLASFFRLNIGGVNFGTHTVIAGSLLAIVSHQLGSLAVFSAVATDPIRKPADPITQWVEDHFRLFHGAIAGTVLFIGGASYLGFVVARWVASGYTQLPFVIPNMIAFTAVVLGLQTVFSSFFLGMIGE